MRILLFLLTLFCSTIARADSCAKSFEPLFTGFQGAKLCSAFSAGTISTLANDTFAVARNAANSANLSVWKADSTDNTFVNAGSGKSIKLAIALTPIAAVGSSGLTFQAADQNIVLAVYVPTMAATPVVGTNMIKAGMNAIPTAAANSAAILGDPTPVAGKDYNAVNTGANTVRIKAGGGATINGATAGGWLPLAANATVHCRSTSATNYNCELPAAPTPQGP